jgi:hypothetical protein
VKRDDPRISQGLRLVASIRDVCQRAISILDFRYLIPSLYPLARTWGLLSDKGGMWSRNVNQEGRYRRLLEPFHRNAVTLNGFDSVSQMLVTGI